jgi:DNA polymerase I
MKSILENIKENSKVLILDGNNFAWRVIYGASPPYEDIDIKKIVLTSYLSLFWKFLPDYIFIFWDGVPAHKLKILPTYKGKRKDQRQNNDYMKDTWENVQTKIPMVKQFLQDLGSISFSLVEGETDDLIAALVKETSFKKCSNTVVSTDRDYVHLLPYTSLFFPKPNNKDTYLQTYADYQKALINLYKVKIDNIFPFSGHLLFQSLMGDSSDSVIGYKGIGPQKAAKGINKLVSQLKNFQFEEIIQNIDSVIEAIKKYQIFTNKLSSLLEKDNFQILKFNFQFFNIQFWIDMYAKEHLLNLSVDKKENFTSQEPFQYKTLEKDTLTVIRKKRKELLRR